MLRSVSRRWTGLASRRLRALSTLPEEAAHETVAVSAELQDGRDTVITSEDGLLLRSIYASHFTAEQGKGVLEQRPGAYQAIAKDTLAKYLPEGLAGDAQDEFEFTKQPAWMVRDTTKLLCRLLEEREKTLNKSWPSASHSAQGMHSTISLPRLTDRPEWDSAQLEVSRYGTRIVALHDEEILSAQRGAQGEPLFSTKGPQCLADRVTARVTAQGEGVVPDKLLLTGVRGAGKSIALNQLVLHARARGWVAVFVPSAWAHAQCGPYAEPVTHPAHTRLYDNPIMSAAALRDIHRAHAAVLRDTPIADKELVKKYAAPLQHFRDQWQRARKVSGRENLKFIPMRAVVREEDHYEPDDELDAEFLHDFDLQSFSLRTLEDLLLLGLALSDCAGLCFIDLVTELRALDKVPVLLAVDEYNAWFAPSAFSFDDKKVSALDLCVPRALHFLDKKKSVGDAFVVKNGMCVAATSLKHSEGRGETFADSLSSLPLRINVPTYNQTEYLSALSFYLTHAPLDPSLSYEDFLHFRMHSGSVPRLLRTETVPFFFPRCVKAADAELRWAMIASQSEESALGEDELVEDEELEELEFEEGVEAEVEEDEDVAEEEALVEEHPDILERSDLEDLRKTL